jgi:hypothetical protein
MITLITIAPSAARHHAPVIILGFARDPRAEPKAGDVVAVEGWGGGTSRRRFRAA